VPRQRVIIAALAATAALAGAATASAQPRENVPCEPPSSGYVSCLQVLYQHGDDGSAKHVKVNALLIERVARCAGHTGRRVVTLTNSGRTRLARAKVSGTCRHGVVRWTAKFPATRTKGWDLQPGDSIDAAWSGTTARTSVEIAPPPGG
jgi:hypothetical protein